MAEDKSNQITNLLERGVEEVIVREHLEAVLKSGRKLRVKFGIDPTASDLHLGHLVVLRKLKQFQDLGHKVVLIIGDFTGMIGDPSGRSETRQSLTEADVKKNLKKYLVQTGKILNIKKAEVHYNGEWHRKKGLKSMLELTATASIQQVLKRTDFEERIKSGSDITVLEILYPLFQGYDSVAVKSDLELGGTDQKFNLLMGRRVQRFYQMKEQDVMTLPLLEGTDGVKKMSKSYGNYIALADRPTDIFGQVMSIPDSLIEKYTTLLTDLEYKKNTPHYEAKLALAKTIVSVCWGPEVAESALLYFRNVFSKKEMPQEMPKIGIMNGTDILDILILAGVKSKSEARRLMGQGAVELNGMRLSDQAAKIDVQNSAVLKVGKTRFFKLILK